METNDKKYCVYIHTNEINGKMYVGITCQSPERRWRKNGDGYLVKKNGEYTQKLFARAILKYGWEEFRHEIIYDNLTEKDAKNYEKWLIYLGDTTNPKYGYNLTEGGEGSCGRIISEETREKLRKANKKRASSEEFRRKMRERMTGINNPNYGKPRSEATRQKISKNNIGKPAWNKGISCCVGENNPFYGKHHSEEAKRKMSEAHKNQYISEETKAKISEINKGEKNHNAVMIVQCDFKNLPLRVWGTASFAAQALHINISHICECCKGPRKTAGGYKWFYVYDKTMRDGTIINGAISLGYITEEEISCLKY